MSVLPIFSKAYERVGSCLIISMIFLIHSWQHFAKGSGASLLGCACSKLGERPWTTKNLLMDLYKAFDRLPHGLLIEKKRVYGLDPEAIDLLSS